MKLIDLLVQELPKRGGWPDGAIYICTEKDGTPRIVGPCWHDNKSLSSFKINDDKSIIYSDQYESALAASQKPAWNGGGLPPVGCECEVSVDGGRSWCTYRAINEKNGVRLIEIGNLTEEFQNNNWIFRPLRTEAERKRDAFINAVLDDMRTIPCDLSLRDEIAVIYDAIAAGKIPGVKLED